MKKNLFVAAAIMVAITACNKEEASVVTPADSTKVWVEFTAGAETKAAIEEGAAEHTIVWEADDEISINGTTFAVTELSEDKSKATFGAEVSEDFTSADVFKAIYPASAGTSFDAISASSTPAVVAGGFDDIVAVAYSTDMSLQFKHVTSLIKFQVPAGFPVNEVTISADGALAGDVKIAMDTEDAIPAITVDNPVNTVTLEGTFEAGKNYYVAVLPGSKTNLTVHFNGYLSKTWTSAVDIKQGRVANMGTLPAPEACDWGLVGEHQGWTIASPTPMYKVADKAYGVLNIILKSNGFKFAQFGLTNWDKENSTFGAWKDSGSGYFNYSTEMSVGAWYGVYTNNLGGQAKNIGVKDFNKSYDVYVKIVQDADWGQELGYTVVEHGTVVTF